MPTLVQSAADLFRHVSAEKARSTAHHGRLRRGQAAVSAAIAARRGAGRSALARRRAAHRGGQAALTQLAAWGNLESQPDTARVSSLERLLPRALSLPALAGRRSGRGGAGGCSRRPCSAAPNCRPWRSKTSPAGCRRCGRWRTNRRPTSAKIHETLRDLVRVFEGLAENAQAFMAGVARSIELQQADAGAVAGYKRRLIDYLERFIGDLVRRSDTIAQLILAWTPRIDAAAAGRSPSAKRATPRPATAQEQAPTRQSAALAGLARTLERSARLVLQQRPRTCRRPNCCGRGRARPSRNCWRRSPRSTSGAAAAATAPPISACWPAGSPPAPTMPRRTGWRAPPSRSIRHGIFR